MSITSKPLDNPNFCFICNHSNDVEYWDSSRFFLPPIPLPETGRKYVCRECVAVAAKEFGFITPEEAQEIKDRNDYLEDQNKHLLLTTDLVKTINDAAATIAEGQPGRAALFTPPVEQSVPDVKKTK